MTREVIENKIVENLSKIRALKVENKQLTIEGYKLQNYTEGMELVPHPTDRRKRKVFVLRGRIHWYEDFVDIDTGKVITIERSRVVMEDNVWDV